MNRIVLLNMFNNRVLNGETEYTGIALDIAETEEEEDFLLNLAYLMEEDYQ